MGKVIKDQVEGRMIRTALGYQDVIRVHMVTDLGDEPGAKRMYLATLEPDIETPGVTPHPYIPNMVCNKVTPSIVPDNNNAIKIVANYVPRAPFVIAGPRPAEFSGGGTIQGQTTTFDINGNVTQWKETMPDFPSGGPDCINIDPSWQPGETVCVGPMEMSVSRPVHNRQITRTEEHDALSVDALVRTYIGKMNSAAWGGWGARSGLVTSVYYNRVIVAVVHGGIGVPVPLDTYVISYEFQWTGRPAGWDNVVIAEIDGKLVQWADPDQESTDDPSHPLGIKVFRVYEEVDFNTLNL